MAKTKITKPVSMAEVAALVAPGETDLGRLCTAEGINKWAKYKPYHAATLTELTDTQRRNAGSLPGVYYGIKMTPGTAQIHGMHSCTYAIAPQARPQGGEGSPYRLQDFSGYNHQALPDFYGTAAQNLPGVPIKNDADRAFSVGITVRDGQFGTSTPANDEISILEITSSGGSVPSLAQYYPMVAISERLGSTYYVRALNADTTGEPRKVDQGGTRETTYWLGADDCTPLQSLTDSQTFHVSYFMGRYLSAGGIDFRQWQPVHSGTLLSGGFQAWGIPGCCGLQVLFGPARISYITQISAGVSADNTGIQVAAALPLKYFTDTYGAAAVPGLAAEYQVSITLASGIEHRKTVTARLTTGLGGELMVLSAAAEFAWADLGMYPMPGVQTEIEATLRAYNPGGSAQAPSVTRAVTLTVKL